MLLFQIHPNLLLAENDNFYNAQCHAILVIQCVTNQPLSCNINDCEY